MVLNVHRTIRLIRDGKMGGGGGEIIYLSLHYHHQNDSCIKIGISCVEQNIVQELCESRGGRPGLSVLTSLLVSVDVKIYCTVLRHWSQLVPNMSHDI